MRIEGASKSKYKESIRRSMIYPHRIHLACRMHADRETNHK